MSWHYQVRRKKIGTKWEYDIVEVYTGNVHTERGISAIGNTKKELIQDLERMLADAKKYRTITDK